MFKLFYYCNWFLLVIGFILLFNVSWISASLIPLGICISVLLYYAGLQWGVIQMRRRKSSIKKHFLAGFLFLELLPVGYLLFQIVF